MSFILDALKKSETERQHKGSAEFASVPTSTRRREGPPAWLWVLGALLLINLAVLVGILLRPGVGVTEQASRPIPVIEPGQQVEQGEDFASRVAAARENAPPIEQRLAAPVEKAPTRATPANAVSVATASAAALPTIHQVQAQGLVTLPELHVDIHVYSESPRDRFVFINMTKLREGTRLSEGPLVEEITPDGVVLSMSGVTFLLPRD